MVENFADSIVDKKRIKDQLGSADTVTLAISKWKPQRLNIYVKRIRISEGTLWQSFILGDDTYGKLGTQNPQPYLGRGVNSGWSVISETGGAEKVTDLGKEEIIKWLKGEAATHFNYVAYGSGITGFSTNQTELVSEAKRQLTFVELKSL